MPVSTNLEILLLSESMTQKATMTSEAIAAIEHAVSSSYALDCAAGGDVVIPYNDTNELSDRTALRLIYLNLTGAPGAAFNVIHPDNAHLFYCKNNTTQTATVKTLLGTGVSIPVGVSAIVYCDGVNVVDLSSMLYIATFHMPYDFDIAVYGRATDGQRVGQFVVGRTVKFPANFAGSVGKVGVNPAATATFTIEDDAVPIGTISITTGGVVSFTTNGGTSKDVAAGSVITVTASNPADLLLADMNVSLLGTHFFTQ